jgi:hypothetical protein
MFGSITPIVATILNLVMIVGIVVIRYLCYKFFLKKYDYKKVFLIPASIIYPVVFFFFLVEGIFTTELGFLPSLLLVCVLLFTADLIYLKTLLRKPFKEFLKTAILINVVYLIITTVFIFIMLLPRIISMIFTTPIRPNYENEPYVPIPR